MITAGAGPHAGCPVATAGAALPDATDALVLLHGRGGSAADMLGLARLLAGPGTAVLAPDAAGQAWYPHRFIEPPSRNEPYLSSARAIVQDLLARIVAAGVKPERIALGGFSQGACLALDVAARHDGPLGAVLGLSGGLIGDRVDPAGWPRHDGLPVLLAVSAQDPHIPLTRVQETDAIFAALGALVTTRVHPGSAHGINPDGVALARRILAGMRG